MTTKRLANQLGMYGLEFANRRQRVHAFPDGQQCSAVELPRLKILYDVANPSTALIDDLIGTT